jgi:hypothetical protein
MFCYFIVYRWLILRHKKYKKHKKKYKIIIKTTKKNYLALFVFSFTWFWRFYLSWKKLKKQKKNSITIIIDHVLFSERICVKIAL